MKITIDVSTGEVKAGNKDCILKSSAIGSCIVVAAWDPLASVGALAHVMLPGSAPAGRDSENETKYAVQAIAKMLKLVHELGAVTERLQICLVGGGNVLKRDDDRICRDNLLSIESILRHLNLPVREQAVGGTVRRSAWLEIQTGAFFYTEGNSEDRLLWKTDW